MESFSRYITKTKQNKQVTTVLLAVILFFSLFIILPAAVLFINAFKDKTGFSFASFEKILTDGKYGTAFLHSCEVSFLSALITTILAFFLAYTECFSNIPGWAKKILRTAAVFPMLLPTITYGFAIQNSFGGKGLYTLLFGHTLFNIYGKPGLIFGYVIYTLPISFTLLRNTMAYIDKRFIIVCRVMGDSRIKTFFTAVLTPMLGTIAVSIVQSFFLAFTDYGIPASIGGQYDVIASTLYTTILGQVPPDYNGGSVLAILMLVPSIFSILLLNYLQRFNVRYNKVSQNEMKPHFLTDLALGLVSLIILVTIISSFVVIFISPFVQDWPNNMSFTLSHFQSVFNNSNLLNVFANSLIISLATALFGTALAYIAALVTARSSVHPHGAKVIEAIAQITNTIPGMVLGIAFLLTFKKTPIHNTIWIIIFCNMVHFFASPFLMMKNTLDKMNAGFETTAKLLGDNWIKTVVRIITPNVFQTLFEIFIYLFINGMVTVSAVVFLAGVQNKVITTEIKAMEHFNEFEKIFILSLLILVTNLIMKGIKGIVNKKFKNKI